MKEKFVSGGQPGEIVVPVLPDRRFLFERLIAVSALGDVIFFSLGMLFVFWFRFQTHVFDSFAMKVTQSWTDYSGHIYFGVFLFLIISAYLKVYDRSKLLRLRQVSIVLMKVCTAWFLFYFFLNTLLKFEPEVSRLFVFLSAVFGLAAVLSWRIFFHRILRSSGWANKLRQRIVIVGWNTESARLAEIIRTDPGHPYDLIGCLPSPHNEYRLQPPRYLPQLGDYSRIEDLVLKRKVDIVLLGDLDPRTRDIIALADLCDRAMVQFKIIPTFFQILISGLHLETVSGVPVLGVAKLPLDYITNRFMKRAMDIAGALVGLIVSAPLILIFGTMIYLESPGPIFFSQERKGRRGDSFRMFKLRSMRVGSEKTDHLNQSTLREDPRLLKIGKFLRKTNIDETPQFLNVLLGHMSLVGPRPERGHHVEKLTGEIPHYNARHVVKPGLSGWAQIHGLRGDTDLGERVRYDLFYMENWTPWLDFYIMARTFMRNKNAY